MTPGKGETSGRWVERSMGATYRLIQIPRVQTHRLCIVFIPSQRNDINRLSIPISTLLRTWKEA